MITLGEYDFSFKLKSLHKASVYEIRVWAFTHVGPGTFASQTVMTEEDGKRKASLRQGSFPSPSFKPRGAWYESIYYGINNTRPI